MAEARDRTTGPSPAPILVAGAGATGLGAALGLARRGRSCRLVDPRPTPGGMASGWQRGGLPLRPGVHLLHASEDRLRPLVDDLSALLGADAIRVQPVSHVHFLGRFLQYPLRKVEVIGALGPRRAASVAASAVAWRLRARLRTTRGGTAPDTFQTVVRDAVGDVLYGLFFRDYTAKVTGLDPADLAGEWARRRVPLPTGKHLLRNLMPWYRPESIDHPHSPFHRLQVTGPDGIDALFGSLLAACDGRAAFQPGASVQRVEVRDGRVAAVHLRRADGSAEVVPAPHLVCTMPLADLAACLAPLPPPDVRQAAARLRHRGLVFVHLALRRPPLLPSHWTYFQDADLPFNRVSEYGAILPSLYGPGRTVVCAELTADPGQPAWEAAGLAGDAAVDPGAPGPAGDLVRNVVDGLQRVRGIPLGDVLEGAWIARERHAYPGWHAGFESDRARVLAHVDAIDGLIAAGRQGRFDYLNLDQCIDAGLAAAARAAGDVGP